jgi:hypothetical protein
MVPCIDGKVSSAASPRSISASASAVLSPAIIIVGRIAMSVHGATDAESKYATGDVVPQGSPLVLQYLVSKPRAKALVTDMHSTRYGNVHVSTSA